MTSYEFAELAEHLHWTSSGKSELPIIEDKRFQAVSPSTWKSSLKTFLELIPFYVTVSIYFGIFIPSDQESVLAAFIKCLPILSLALFVLLKGLDTKKNCIDRKFILFGLIFSGVGDVLLVWTDLFVFGMIAFGVGHYFYIRAFGFHPLKLKIGIVLYFMATIMSFLLLPGLTGVLVYGVPIYSYILATMTWRTLARISSSQIEPMEWYKIFIGVTGISWMLSDASLAYHHFISPLPFSQVIIMATYYFGQFGMALSILDDQYTPYKFTHS